MFVHAVVIAGDGSGSDVYAFTDDCVAQISQVIGLRSFTKLYLLSLNEVADVSFFSDLASRTQVRIRSDNRARFNSRIVHDRALPNEHTIANNGILDHRSGTNPAIGTDLRFAKQLNEW